MFGDRLMVGLQVLALTILVRIQVPEFCAEKNFFRFFYLTENIIWIIIKYMLRLTVKLNNNNNNNNRFKDR